MREMSKTGDDTQYLHPRDGLGKNHHAGIERV